MRTFKNISITVSTLVNLPVEKVWQYWTLPEHITKWCQASDDWHAPFAENDLRLDGKFKTTMAAKDGSSSFDFEGIYTDIHLYDRIEYMISDGRIVNISFLPEGSKTRIIETFEAEDVNSKELQQDGWQAILDSFKNYAESMENKVRLHFETPVEDNRTRINKLYPCMWFDGKAKAAAMFYSNVFGNSVILDETPLVVTFELHGQKFMALNGGPMFTPNPSISFYVVYEKLNEVEEAWAKLIEGGSVLMPMDKYPWSEKYGWVQDRFGISWQLSYGKMEDVGRKFSPTLMFTRDNAGKAEEAIHFYTKIFTNSSIAGILKYSAEDEDVEGYLKHAQFKLANHVFMAMDSSAAHAFSFNEAISIVVECENQEEIDYYWEKLTSDGGEESMCGWLKDKYGVSWQIIPSSLSKLMADPETADRVGSVLQTMKKLDIEKLLSA